MSNNPYASPSPFGDSSSYRSPGANPVTPVAATVFGILNLVFGIFGICGNAFSAVGFLIPINAQMAAQNPVLKLMNDNQGYRLFLQGSVVAGFLGTIVLITAGAGLLTQRPLGRQLSIGWAIYAIIAVLLGLVVNVLVVFPVLIKQFNELPPGGAQGGAIGGIIGGIVGAIVGVVYPALLLYFMYTPKVIAAYRS